MSEKKDNSNKLLYCAFCGKSQNEVKKLIAGPSVYICDECIELCDDILQEEVTETTSTATTTPTTTTTTVIPTSSGYGFRGMISPESGNFTSILTTKNENI